MLKRYPHTAIYIAKVKTLTPAVPDNGITGRDKGSEVRYEILGRFEDTSDSRGDYRAKFYAKPHSIFQYVGSDSDKLEIAGRSFDVLRAFPFQTHVEIWLA